MRPRHLLTTILLSCLLLSANIAANFDRGIAAYETGDYKTVFREFKSLAEKGNTAAKYDLGMMQFVGDGLIQDNVYAHMWFNTASSNRNGTARKNRDIVAKKLTPKRMADAPKLARECVKKDYNNCQIIPTNTLK